MDLTVAAIPFYFSSMGAEAWWMNRTKSEENPRGGDYELADTLTSLGMGTASLIAPLLLRSRFRKLDPGRARLGKVVLGVAGGAALAAVVADALARSAELEAGQLSVGNAAEPDLESSRETPAEVTTNRRTRRLRKIAGSAALASITSAVAVAAGTWANRTMATRLFKHRVLPDWGTGVIPSLAAIAGWDFIYYWNHRLQHETRFMWAIHVVHHSSQHYNLSTALRQPVADVLGLFVPYGVMSLLGVNPVLIERARGVNLIYQYWIHTEVIRSIGVGERFLNTPSHHRVHHGSNSQYLDRNHGSILIVWDRLFGTFEPEDEEVVYGLTKNIETHNLLRVATHEYADIASDVVEADSWKVRLSQVFRGPGWGLRNRETDLADAA